MEYPVYCGQTLAGRVYLRENSGRLQAEMVCRRDDSGLFRGWLVGERGELALGVLAPEAEGLCARRLLPEDWRAVLGEVLRGEMRLSFPFRAEEGWRKVEEPRRFFRCSAGRPYTDRNGSHRSVWRAVRPGPDNCSYAAGRKPPAGNTAP